MSSFSVSLCLALLLAAAPGLVRPFPSGPPAADHFNQVCELMTPLHHDNVATAGTGGFRIDTDLTRNGFKGFNYEKGKEYTVTVNGTESTFRGFLVIAHVPGEDNMLLGSFTPQNMSQQTLNCSFTGATNEMTSTIAHNNSAKINFTSITTKWTAPEDKDGMVDFRYTVVHNFTTFYTYQRASLNGLSPPIREAEKYRLTFSDPPKCDPSSCKVFVGIDTNVGDSDYLDIYLEGEANGWVAVGFTETASMFSSDVVACNVDPDTGIVQGLDTYNDPDERANIVDGHQNVVHFSGNYSDGRIRCSIAKKIEGVEPPPVNVNLDSDLYILYGRRKEKSANGSLLPHEDKPTISAKKYNPVKSKSKGEGDNFPKLPLVRAHGVLMLIAWPLLGVSGIFFALWMQPAMPKGQWFQIHRVFMIASLCIGVVGVAMVFIGHAHEDNPRGLIRLGSDNPVATAHFAIGLFIILLHIVNPIIALFRCHPTGKWRWVFNLVHGLTIGIGAGVLAFVNVGLGTYIFDDGMSDIFVVYIGYVSFIVLLFGVMFFVFSITTTFIRDPESYRMAPPVLRYLLRYTFPSTSYDPINTDSVAKVTYGTNDDTPGEGSAVSAKPTIDSPIRWASLILYLAVSVPLIVTMVILAAGGAINT